MFFRPNSINFQYLQLIVFLKVFSYVGELKEKKHASLVITIPNIYVT